MTRSSALLFAAVIALVVYAVTDKIINPDDEKPHAREEKINAEDYYPPCVNTQGAKVEFATWQHKNFSAEYPGLVAAVDDQHIVMDYDELQKHPAEYRDFVFRAACARNLKQGGTQADCTTIKRLRDEKGYSKEKVTLIAQVLGAAEGAKDEDARVRNINACFEAR